LVYRGNAGLADPAIIARVAEFGGVPPVYTPAELSALIASDVAKSAKILQRAGFEPQ
jgi:hypothetical protein